MDIVEEMRGFAEDHEPDGWPAVRMRQISALCDEIDKLREALLRLRKWGGIANGNYSSTVMLGVTDWIDGGMVGELPALPDHAAPNASSTHK